MRAFESCARRLASIEASVTSSNQAPTVNPLPLAAITPSPTTVVDAAPPKSPRSLFGLGRRSSSKNSAELKYASAVAAPAAAP